MGVTAAVVVFLSVAAVAAAQGPAPPVYTSYKAYAELVMPYRGISETIVTWYDAEHNRQRIEYDMGMDTYIFLPNSNMTYMQVPVITAEDCFTQPGPTSTTTIFPDLSQYSFAGVVNRNGENANMFTYQYTVNTKVNTYSFYALSDGTPLAFNFLGLDTLLGSHYDEYNLTYIGYIPGTAMFNESTFSAPSSHCTPSGGLPGDGSPLDMLSAVMSPYTPKSPPHTKLGAEFDALAERFQRSYASAKERTAAMAEFVQNKRLVGMLNRRRKQPAAAWFSLNHMFDWSPSRMARLRGTKKSRPAVNRASFLHTAPSAEAAAALPDSVDWRLKGAVGPVMDQGDCGSCWSFGTAGTIEGSLALATGSITLLSQQELVDCSWQFGNTGCNGGLDFQAYEWIMANGGLSAASGYGQYLMRDGWCHSQAAIAERKRMGESTNHGGDGDDDFGPGVAAVLKGYANVTSGDEWALLDALANHGPVSVSIDAALNSFGFYSSGVYSEPGCLNGLNDLDHTVLAVGYGTENGADYWLIKNSWSVHYGDQGYIKISRDNNNCGVATAATYVFLEN